MGGLRNGDRGDGLHRLYGHGDIEEKPGGYVVEGGKDKGSSQVKVGDEGEGNHDGDESAQVPHGAGEF